ncbi:DUF4870 domain-containing protein [Microbacterium sp. NPDC089189]|uniref:DUF4870 domain-containing protein n=1 Tax=Microbacterium sp. NPDC089189 TaxID=3154972 RepID=UPI00343919D4
MSDPTRTPPGPPPYAAPAGMPVAPPPGAAPGWGPRPSTGVVSWALGFIVFVPLGLFFSGIAMAIPYASLRRRGPVAQQNGRAALNWGLTFTLLSFVLLFLHVVLLFSLAYAAPAQDFYPLGIPITLYGVLVLLHVVLVIVGTVRASSGKLMRVPFAIPFVRA